MERLIFPVTRREAEKQGISFSSDTNKSARFPSRLKELREKTGVSQAKLAGILGVSKSTISLYEVGDTLPDAKTLYDMANYFNVSADYLLCRTNNQSTDQSIQTICAQTGLSEEIVAFLVERPTYPHLVNYMELDPREYFNKLFSTNNLYNLLPKLCSYFTTIETVGEMCSEIEDIIKKKKESNKSDFNEFRSIAQDHLQTLEREYRWCHFEVIDYFTRILNEVEEQEKVAFKIQNIRDLCEET